MPDAGDDLDQGVDATGAAASDAGSAVGGAATADADAVAGSSEGQAVAAGADDAAGDVADQADSIADSDTGQAVASDASAAGAGAVATVGGSDMPDAGAAGGAIAAGAGGAVAAGGMAASVVSAMIQCVDEPFPPIVFSYNPAEYSETFEGVWRRSIQPATSGGTPQWVGYKPQDVTVKILLDEFAVPPMVMPLQAVVAQLKMMVKPTALSLGDGRATAPMVMFMWGDNIILDQAYIRSVRVNYQRFFLGNPVRAEAEVHLSQVPFPAPLPSTNPTSGGVATRKTRTMVAGDSLPSIAFEEYKDPNKWRALAEANGIDDPMRVKMGTVIAVPDRREAENRS